ncbi:hypothetical protein DVH24_006596 [Malus domestica]|uniref:Uncharacterized protein n=1 Tax=Malus domestica TaxID=3750 RepID=A0A498KAU9_MALDO|nr:hypothetical protein DVH24_006596 [Malus domestica]
MEVIGRVDALFIEVFTFHGWMNIKLHEENLRLAKVQMAEQLKAMLAHVGINIGSFGVGALQSTSTQQQGCGSSHPHISTLFEGGNDKNVQFGPPVSSAMMHEDCQSENAG